MSTTFRVKILKCSDPALWYRLRIGEIFEVDQSTTEEGQVFFWCRTRDILNTYNFILPKDCAVQAEEPRVC